MDITNLPSPSPAAEMTETERRRHQIIEEMLKEVTAVKNNNQLAAFSKEDLMTELFVRSVNERVAGRDDDAASDQQSKYAVAAAAKEKEESVANNNNKLPHEQDNDEDAAKRKSKKTKRSGGGFISTITIMMVAFGIMILSLSLIHQIGGSGEGEAPPAFAPSASRSLRVRERQREHLSDDDNAASPEAEVIMSPLPASIGDL